MSRYLACLIVFCMMFTLGCRGTTYKKDDAAFRQQVMNGARLVAIPIETDHDGNTGARNATLGHGLVGALINATAQSLTREEEEVKALNKRVLQAVGDTIYPQLTIVETYESPEDMISLMKNTKSSKVAAFAQEYDAQAVLKIWINFTHNGQWKTNLSMYAYWTLYDAQGKKRVEITTLIDSQEQVSNSPNTYKAKYQDQYVDLTRQSAQEFLRLMRGEEPSANAVIKR